MKAEQRRNLVIAAVTLLTAYLITRVPLPLDLAEEGVTMMAITVVGAVFWITECIPISMTALLIILLQAVFGIQHISDGLRHIATPVNSIIFAGFIMATALSKYKLDRRIGLQIVAAMGEQTDRLLLGIMAGTAFLSMWISNSAATVIMLPIAIGIMNMGDVPARNSNLRRAMTIGIACAANIGGMGTPAGTPASSITIAFISDMIGTEVRFMDWMIRALPAVVIIIPIAWKILLHLYPAEVDVIRGGGAAVRRELQRLGTMTKEQKHVLLLFCVAVLLWIGDSLLPLMPGWLYIASVLIVLIFIAPGIGVVKWEEASVEVGWDIFILVGGGLSLGRGLSDTGVIALIADGFSVFMGDMSGFLVVTILAMLTAYSITFFSSLTATSTTYVPVAIGLAYQLGLDPVALAMVAGMASCLAFLLPANTPPNAIAYATGYFKSSDMLKNGLLLTFFSALVLSVTASVLWF